MSAKISELTALPGGVITEGDLIEVVRGAGNYKFPAQNIGVSGGSLVIKTIDDDATYVMAAEDSGSFIVITDESEMTAIWLPEFNDESIEVGMFWWVYRSNLGSGSVGISHIDVSFQVPVQGSTWLRARGVARIICIAPNVYMAHGDFVAE